jgi:hypothetical protein
LVVWPSFHEELGNDLINFSGENGALEETSGVSGACHKCFKTEAQAEAFIEDWKESYAEVVRQVVRKGLDEGLRPRDMSLKVEGLLQEVGQAELLAEQLGTRLELGESWSKCEEMPVDMDIYLVGAIRL